MQYNYSKIDSPVGLLHLVSNSKKIIALIFNKNWNDSRKKITVELINKKDDVIYEAEKQLKEYFAGQRKKFDIPVELAGTEFQKQAWQCLQQIPFGKTMTYGEQAAKMKNAKAVRAVGGANGRNQICIIIPCHRVIGQNGSLTGFSGGLKIKKQLLKFENTGDLCE